MSGPGWYPDPQDAASLRWFDGDDWTEYRQQLDPGANADTAVTAVTEPVAAGGTGYGGTAGATGYGGTGYGGTAGATGYGATGATGYGATGATGYGATGATGYGATGYNPAEAYDPYSARASNGAATADSTVPASTQALPEPVPSGPPARANHAAGGRAKLDRRLVLIVVAVIVVVGALIAGAIALFSGGSDNTFTYQGKSIANASKPLQLAEANLSSLVTKRHGATNSSTRCYYAVPTNPAGAKKTDIDQLLSCGPVLFVDGSTDAAYLSFGFTSAASGGSVTLTPNQNPTRNDPAAVASDLVLKRPDGKKPPAGAGGLSAPKPLAAAANIVTAAVVSQPAGTKATVAIIGSFNGGITITDIGKIDRYGKGDDARSAPPNQQLYAFTLAGAAGNSGVVKDLSSSTTVAVDSGAGRAVPTEVKGQSVVIAVPTSAKSVVLTLNDGGIKQTFSVMDAKLGAGNIKVLARSHRSISVNQSLTATYNYSTKVVFADKVTGQTQTATLALAGVTLAYRDDVNSYTASAPDKALLIPDLVYTGSHDGGPYGIDTSLLTFTPTDSTGTKGAAIAAQNISTDASKIRNVFEVPADVTTGIITVGGTATETFSGSTGTYTLTVAAPMSFTVNFPAG